MSVEHVDIYLKMLFLVGHVLRATEMRSFFDNKKSTKMIAILKSPLIASKIPKILNLKATQNNPLQPWHCCPHYRRLWKLPQ